MQQLVDALRNHPTIAVAILALLLGILCAVLLERIERLKDRLHVAQAAAEDAAKAAALATPGGIDPEVVVELLRRGERPTLDTVYAAMETRARDAARSQRTAAERS